MSTKNLIEIEVFCANHNIEITFINRLQHYELIELITINEEKFVNSNQLLKIEKFIRLFYELNINLEGIDCIAHLLNRINVLQDEIIVLKNRISFYETEY